MNRRSWVAGGVVAALVVAAVVMVARRPGPRLTPLSAEMKRDFGAMAHVPADVAVYSSAYRVLPRWRSVWESRAVQSLLDLPLAQQARQQVVHHPMARGLLHATRTNPTLVQGLPVLEDALSTEVFVCLGPELPEVLEALSHVVYTVWLAPARAALAGREPSPQEGMDVAQMVSAVLANREHLRMPSMLLGFRLTDTDAARRFLDTWVPPLSPTPLGPIETETIGGADFYTLRLSGESIPPGELDKMVGELHRSGVPARQAEQLTEWLRGLKATVALGLRDDLLLLSVGQDTALLERWGQGDSLAASPALEPLRAHHKPGLMSVSYSSQALAETFTWTPEDVRQLADDLIGSIRETSATAGLKERLRQDVDRLLEDVEAVEPSSSLAFSFENRGIETYRFGGPPLGHFDDSRPLSILAHRGKAPITVSASRAGDSTAAYEQVVKILRIGFGIVQDYAVPTMEPEDRTRYETFMGLARPFLKSVDATTRECLLPAVGSTQRLMSLDGEGEVSNTPTGEPLPDPLPVPRLGMAVELRDSAKFREAMERYAQAMRDLLAAVRETYGPAAPPKLTLPPPETETTEQGTLYFYRLPWALGEDVFPCALLTDKLVVLSTSRRFAEEMAATEPLPTCPVTAPDQAAGTVALTDCSKGWALLRRLTNAAFALIQRGQPLRPRQQQKAMLVKMHLDGLWRSLGAFRSYRSTTGTWRGRAVRHSWLHVEDIGP